MRDSLVQNHQVPREIIVPELRSLSTAENALFSVELLTGRALSRVAIVTCDWHLPRALANFRAVGVTPVGLAAPSPPVRLPRRLWRASRECSATLIDRCSTWGRRAS